MGSFWGKAEAVEIFWALIVSLERLGSCDGGGVRVHDVCQTTQIDPQVPPAKTTNDKLSRTGGDMFERLGLGEGVAGRGEGGPS